MGNRAERNEDMASERGLGTFAAIGAVIFAAAIGILGGCQGDIGDADPDDDGDTSATGDTTTTSTSGTGAPGSTSGGGGMSGSGGAGQGGAGQGGMGGMGGMGSSSSTGSGGSNDAIAQLCVDTINMHRASIGLAPYGRWSGGEMCASDQCKSDSMSGQAHGAFGQCGEWAQNECPGWPGPPESMIQNCLQMMWDEGPGQDFQKHGHYINMSSTQYNEVACGFYQTPNGSWWAIQNFH